MLTAGEYDALFRRFEKELDVKNANGVILVTPREGERCPHLLGHDCQVYQDRPIDCRLYPYMMVRVVERGHRATVFFTPRSLCPENDRIRSLMSEDEAKTLVVTFWKQVYDEGWTIDARCEKGPVSRLLQWIETIRGTQVYPTPTVR